VTEPKAGMFVWAKIPPPFEEMGSMAFAVKLMDEANVAVAPGIGFGEEGEGYLRLALVENEHRLRQALRQMGKFMRARMATDEAENQAPSKASGKSPATM
jgi:alanine-synthesizing transaminase